MRFRRQWAAVVRLPSGMTRMVILREQSSSQETGSCPPTVLDLGMLYERRDWIRDRVARLQDQAPAPET